MVLSLTWGSAILLHNKGILLEWFVGCRCYNRVYTRSGNGNAVT